MGPCHLVTCMQYSNIEEFKAALGKDQQTQSN